MSLAMFLCYIIPNSVQACCCPLTKGITPKSKDVICSTPKMKNMTSSCSLSCTKMDMILLNNAFTKENVLWAVFRFFQYSSVLKSLRISPRLRLKLYFTSKICFLASFCRGTVQFVILLPPLPVSFAWFKLMFICC